MTNKQPLPLSVKIVLTNKKYNITEVFINEQLAANRLGVTVPMLRFANRKKHILAGMSIEYQHQDYRHQENLRAKLPVVIQKDNIIMRFDSSRECAEFLGVSRSTVCSALKKKHKTKGWSYLT